MKTLILYYRAETSLALHTVFILSLVYSRWAGKKHVKYLDFSMFLPEIFVKLAIGSLYSQSSFLGLVFTSTRCSSSGTSIRATAELFLCF